MESEMQILCFYLVGQNCLIFIIKQYYCLYFTFPSSLRSFGRWDGRGVVVIRLPVTIILGGHTLSNCLRLIKHLKTPIYNRRMSAMLSTEDIFILSTSMFSYWQNTTFCWYNCMEVVFCASSWCGPLDIWSWFDNNNCLQNNARC